MKRFWFTDSATLGVFTIDALTMGEAMEIGRQTHKRGFYWIADALLD